MLEPADVLRPHPELYIIDESSQPPVLTILQRRKRFLSHDDSNIPGSQDTRDSQQSAKKRRGRNSKPMPMRCEEEQDELGVYLTEPPVAIQHYAKDPVAWWQDIGAKRFPRLSYMATDYLTIPSAQAATERQFNSVGAMISPRRSRLDRSLVAMAQCLRSWNQTGAYEVQLPLHLLDRTSRVVSEDSELRNWANGR